MSKQLTILGVILGLGILVALQSLFVVTQTQQALVLRFGEIKQVVNTPGLHMKLPFIDNVQFFDKRLLEFNASPQEFITKDRNAGVEERVVIDAFVRYRIINPVKFYQAVQNEAGLKSRLQSIVISSMRKIIASNSLNDLLSEKRSSIMEQIQQAVNRQATSESQEAFDKAMNVIDEKLPEGEEVEKQRYRRQGFGIEVVDVRIMRADLPDDISQATYERMRKNFTKEAQKFRAEGEEIATKIRAAADRERVELLAEARRKAETLRGEGDAEAAKIYANAFNKDKEFFEFYRTMQSYRKALKQDDTTLILTPNSEFLKELQ